MTTSETSSETKKRNLTVFDMMNGARIVGESVAGFDNFTVINPTVLTLEKEEGSDKVKVSTNPVLFTTGTLYQVQPHSVVARYQCFDATVHGLYENALSGGKEQNGANDTSSESVADA